MTQRGCKGRRAFTLIEIVGVLAIVSVLAAILLPKVFEAIHNARVSTVSLGLHTIKTASVQHFVRYNTFASREGVPLTFTQTYDGFDLVLLAEGLIDKPFRVRVGTNTLIRLVDVSTLTTSSDPLDEENPGAYDLDGDGNNDIVGATYLLEAVFDEPQREDVASLNERLDGPSMGFSGPSDDDSKGKVVYRDRSNDPAPNANPSARKRRPGTMYIYIAHR